MPRTRKPTDVGQLKLRLPEALRQRLEDASNKSGRSLNNETVWRLTQTFGDEGLAAIFERVEERERDDAAFFEKVAQDPRMQEAIRKVIAKHLTEKP